MPSEPSTVRIGIVEDDVVLRGFLEQTVASIDGLSVVRAVGTLQEGLELAASGCGLLLVDLALPDGSGLELIARVRASLPDCRVLVVSVFGDVHNVVRAIEMGADGYLLKGASAAELASAVQTVLAGGAPISPAVAGHILRRIREEVQGKPGRIHKQSLPLTPKEVQVLDALAKGLSYKEVAALHGISPHTVADHVKAIYRKLEVNSRGEAVFEGLQAGIIKLES